VLVVAAIVGWASGHIVLALALGFATLCAWQFLDLVRMHRWLHGRAALPRRRAGLLGDVERVLERLQDQARKRKRRLRKAATRFQQGAEANPDGSMTIGRDGRIEWLNRAAARMLGLRQGQDQSSSSALPGVRPEDHRGDAPAVPV